MAVPDSPQLIAFDFDGVICDGLIEYFQTAWRAYSQCFATPSWDPAGEALPPDPPAGFAQAFYRLRPIVETGWEMPVVIQALAQGLSEAEITQGWPGLAKTLVAEAGLEPMIVAKTVDRVRDSWIQQDLTGWLALHRFYPGVLDCLSAILHSRGFANAAQAIPTYIISTKEGRFIHQLLAQRGIDFPADRIFGKEVKRPKSDTLSQLIQQHQPQGAVWFLEDRLKTLQAVAQVPELKAVHLFLADWGYNTPADHQAADECDRIQRLSLDQLPQRLPTL
jgi:phosphoglycolate phosphatase-like HAD superfamily hydrolase